jgi:hypothetical protein
MTVEESIVSRLLVDQAVADLVSDRIRPHTRDQDPAAIPAITFQRLATDENMTTEGPDTSGKVSLQVDVWAATPDEAMAVSLAVRATLAGAPGVGINGAFRRDASGPVQDPEVLVYRVRSVYDVHFGEGVSA